jgi:glycosyltransferase involved in cell wall biosynthesis
VLGDAALLVSPSDVDALADALVQVAGDDELRRLLQARGIARARRYSWGRAIDELVGLYRSVA